MMNEEKTSAAGALKTMIEAMRLAKHKIEQTLDGQYTDGAALSAALDPLSAALAAAPRVINAHEALVGAVEQAAEYMQMNDRLYSAWEREVYAALRAALAAVKVP